MRSSLINENKPHRITSYIWRTHQSDTRQVILKTLFGQLIIFFLLIFRISHSMHFGRYLFTIQRLITARCYLFFILTPSLSSPITYHKKIFVIHFLTKTGTTRIQLGGQFVFPLSPPVTFLIFIYLFRVRCFVRLTCKSYKFYYPCLLLC